MGTTRTLPVGGFLLSKWQPTNIDETRIATVTVSLIFTKVITPIMAGRRMFPFGIRTGSGADDDVPAQSRLLKRRAVRTSSATGSTAIVRVVVCSTAAAVVKFSRCVT
jgi:hypothetical protein